MNKSFLEGWLSGWLGGPPAPGGNQIKKKWGWGEKRKKRGREMGLTEVAFPGLGPGGRQAVEFI